MTIRSLAPDGPYQALLEIGAQIQAEERDLERVFELIVQKTAELVGADVAWLGLVDADEARLDIRTSTGAAHEAFERMSVDIGKGVGGAALARRETIVVPDYASYLNDTPESVRAAVTEEGVLSLVCAPMLREGRMVGALFVGNRTRTEFSGHQASLVTALAGQASIAIENSRLLEQLESKNRLLEQSAAIHRTLTDASLERAGLDDLIAAVAAVLERALVVEQSVVPPFHRRASISGRSGGAVRDSLPIVAGEEKLGRVDVTGEPLDELGRRALEHGAMVLAVELLRERTAQDVEWRLGGELLTELLEASGPVDRHLAARLSRFGIDATQPVRIIVVEVADGEIDHRAVRLAASGALAPESRAVLLTGLGATRAVLGIPHAVEEHLDALLEALAASVRHLGRCALGVSRPATDLSRGLREALACARFASLSGRDDAVVRADDLGAMRFLFALEDPAPLQEYVEEQLGPLLSDPRSRDGQLLLTLRAFLEADGHHATIAARCHIHKSTVKYRLGRIATVLGRSLSEPDVRFELRLAVALADVLEALALGPPLAARAQHPG